MERFTEKFKDGRNILRNGIADVFHIRFGRFFEGDAIDKFAEYEDLEEQGLILKIPCKAGDTLYKIYKRPTKCSVHGQYRDDYSCFDCEEKKCDSSYEWSMYKCKTTIKDIVCIMDEIGKTVFLTQSEAEEALKRMEREE